MTIPRVAFSVSGETAANVCPPTIQLRIRNPCIEKTFRRLGIMAAGYLHEVGFRMPDQRQGVSAPLIVHKKKPHSPPRKSALDHSPRAQFGAENCTIEYASGTQVTSSPDQRRVWRCGYRIWFRLPRKSQRRRGTEQATNPRMRVV